MNEIRPTGAYRAWGWSLLALGVVLLVAIGPLFTIGGATDQGDDGPLLMAIGRIAPWVGVTFITAAITLLVMAAKRAAANREAAQRAILARYPAAS